MSVATMTPSKVAAQALDTLTLTKPILNLAPKVDEITTDGRDRFVGNLNIKNDKDEPLLKESAQRFVLFPIKYNEVRRSIHCLLLSRFCSKSATIIPHFFHRVILPTLLHYLRLFEIESLSIH
jgi:hypothetical protein